MNRCAIWLPLTSEFGGPRGRLRHAFSSADTFTTKAHYKKFRVISSDEVSKQTTF